MSPSHRKRPGVSHKPKPSVIPLLLMLGGVVVLGLTIFLAARGHTKSATNFTPEVMGSPKLESDREEVDLGEVRLGQTVEVAFEIANTGDKPLRFSEVPYVEVVEGC